MRYTQELPWSEGVLLEEQRKAARAEQEERRKRLREIEREQRRAKRRKLQVWCGVVCQCACWWYGSIVVHFVIDVTVFPAPHRTEP